jgi:hypothetical protein
LRRKVYVPVGELGAAASLMLRNADANGRSVARIYGVEIRQVSPVEEIEERLRHTGPVEPPVRHGLSAVQALGPPVVPPAFQPIRVETGALHGSNAASFDLTWPLDLTGIGMPRVVVDVEVESGTLGIGCMTADQSSFVDREQFVSAGLRRKVYVPVGELGAAASLMLRNADANGRSVARIYDVEIRQVSSVEEIEERLRLTPFQMAILRTVNLPRMFAVVSWGAAATQWLAAAFNDCPGVFCLHSGHTVWRIFADVAKMDGLRYLQIVGMQGCSARLAGDIHGISSHDIPSIKQFFGDTFRSAVLIRDPLPRLQSQLAVLEKFSDFRPMGDLEYLDDAFPDALKRLPTGDYVERLFVHAANMLNGIIYEISVGPVFRMEGLTQDAAMLRSALEHLSAGEISPPPEWASKWTNSRFARNKHSDGPRLLKPWQADVLRAIVKPEAVQLYESFGYDMSWLNPP